MWSVSRPGPPRCASQCGTCCERSAPAVCSFCATAFLPLPSCLPFSSLPGRIGIPAAWALSKHLFVCGELAKGCVWASLPGCIARNIPALGEGILCHLSPPWLFQAAAGRCALDQECGHLLSLHLSQQLIRQNRISWIFFLLEV